VKRRKPLHLDTTYSLRSLQFNIMQPFLWLRSNLIGKMICAVIKVTYLKSDFM